MDINKVTLIGRLTARPEARSTATGQHLASFGLATNYIWKDFRTKEKKDKTEFHTVIAWGKLADIVNTYLEKGSRVYVEGRLQYRKWKDPKNQLHRMTDIIADELIMLGHKSVTSQSKSDEALAKEEPSEKELVVEEV